MNGKNVKRMFNKIWKEQIVKPTSKVGIFKPKQGFDLEEEEDENKCMEEVEKIGDYISSEFAKVKNQKFESNNPEHPFLYHYWAEQNYMQKPEVNPFFAACTFPTEDQSANLPSAVIHAPVARVLPSPAEPLVPVTFSPGLLWKPSSL